MRRIIITALISTLSHMALADICFQSFERDTAQADLIFIGKVIDIKRDALWGNNGSPKHIFTFEIIESFKGLSAHKKVISILSTIRGCCSPQFKWDSTFLVSAFALRESPDVYWTNDCSITAQLSGIKPYYIDILRNSAATDKRIKPQANNNAEMIKFENSRNWLQKQMDSIHLAHATLSSDFASEKRKNSYMMWIIIIMALAITVLAWTIYKRKTSKVSGK